ncbi:DUF7146 domain-containing protein [Novosphingobium guangzhouense]|uniref:Virulence-associated protein E n=1 Tax=Novosphingobium guangzhouense TaxID=1850347 RepID=A0A2K2FYF0_9SPHN|nr:toprim domain-containing protein [Novosphingobium guangzhouense]PNU03790.1 virulence-associated protein E [Novosphingobium guangzhouense]
MSFQCSFRNPDLEALGAEIVTRLGGTWRPGKGLCRCPVHDDRRPSLSVRVGERALLFKCFAGCDTLDVMNAVRSLTGEALSRCEYQTTRREWMTTEIWRRRRALAVWEEATEIFRTPAQVYLRQRHITILPRALRFHPRTPIRLGSTLEYRPAMIAALCEVDASGGRRFHAIQRTFFDRKDARRARDLPAPRMTMGRPANAAVILAEATSELGLAEGVETALSAMMLFGIPVWATLGSDRLHQVTIPSNVTRLVLFPDNDPAGARGSMRAVQSHKRPGRTIETAFPPAFFKDWNDVLRLGGEGVGE